MRGDDFLFYAFSFAAIASALVSALRADLSRASSASLACGVALAGLLGLVSAALPAALVGATAFAGYASMQRRAGASESEEPAAPFLDAAATVSSRLRSAALVVAFFAIVVRAVLIARWPIASAARVAGAPVLAVPPVTLVHYLVVALVLLAIGLFAAISRRSVAGVGLGLATASGAAALALGADSHFVVGSGAAADLAALVVLLTAAGGAATVRVARECGDLARSSDAAWRVAGGLSTVLAGVTLALLATAW